MTPALGLDLNDPQLHSMFTAEEIQEMAILSDPMKWAEDRLGWIARGYQEEFFVALPDKKQIVLRWGRRLGKTDSLVIASLYYADTQLNIDIEKGSYTVMIVCPFDSQVDAIFDRMKVIVENSPKLNGSVKFTHHKAILANGSKIMGKTAGSKQNSGAASLRGQGPDVLLLDEMDYLSDKDVMNIYNYRNEAPNRIKIIAASTPRGDRRMFYKWCTEAEDLGWYHIHRTSLVNPEITKVNPDNKLGLTYLEELQQQFTQLEYAHEVLAEFGEAQAALFHKKFIDAAVVLGRDLNIRYYDLTEPAPRKHGPRILGCDWDRAAASTNMIVIELDRHTGRFMPVTRVEIPSHEFTYTMAVEKIIALNEHFDLDFVYVDKGYGEKQIEDLKRYGMMHPDSGLLNKVVGIQFSQKVEVRDPLTKLKIKKDIKPFMVNNAVNVFEKGIIALQPKDYKVIKQLENYAIKNVTDTGRPTYVEQEEHIVDCFSLALFGFEQQYGELFSIAIGCRMVGIDLDPKQETQHAEQAAKQAPRVMSLYGAVGRPTQGRGCRPTPIMRADMYSRRSF